MNYIPQSYEDWEHCITVACGIPLTPEYVARRIAALEDRSDFHTEKFIARWGTAHHARTVAWFRKAQSRLSSATGAAH